LTEEDARVTLRDMTAGTRCFAAISSAVFALLGCAEAGEISTATEALHLESTAFHYLRCSSTGWTPSDANRLVPMSGGSTLLTLTYEAADPSLLQTGEACVITETPVLNGWGDWHSYYSAAEPLTAPGSVELTTTGARMDVLRVRYSELGRYRATLDTATGRLSITPADGPSAPPRIVRSPQRAVGVIGEPVEFSVEAEGEGLRYQWQSTLELYTDRGWTDIPGATGRRLVTQAPRVDAYCTVFRVRVSNDAGTVVSDYAAVVPVNAPPVFLEQLPEELFVREGESLSVTVRLAPEPRPSYLVFSLGDRQSVRNDPTGEETFTTDPVTLADDGLPVSAAAVIVGPNHSCGGGSYAEPRTATLRVLPAL
jgi:hypothetical protein